MRRMKCPSKCPKVAPDRWFSNILIWRIPSWYLNGPQFNTYHLNVRLCIRPQSRPPWEKICVVRLDWHQQHIVEINMGMLKSIPLRLTALSWVIAAHLDPTWIPPGPDSIHLPSMTSRKSPLYCWKADYTRQVYKTNKRLQPANMFSLMPFQRK